jgi:peptidoglycan/LPS O-acetylase OafA/YrhL
VHGKSHLAGGVLRPYREMERDRSASDRRLPHAPALDGLRAFAVAGVLLYHGGVAWMPGGFLGVDVFFVLSGYLITSLLLAEWMSTRRIDLKRFWLRRARRLLPAAVLVILVALLVVAVFLPGDAARMRGDALASLLYVNNWNAILADHSYFSAFERPSLLQHLWSLAVEEQFYLLWPIALGGGLVLLGRARLAAVIVALALVSATLMAWLYEPGHDPTRVYFGTDTHALPLLAGALLAFAWPLGRMGEPPARSARVVIDAVAAVSLAGLVVAMIRWHDYDPGLYPGGIALAALLSAALIAAVVHPSCRVGRGLGWGPLRWIGDRSYGIYLWHWPVMALTRPDLDVPWSRWVLVPTQIALTVALAAASYRWLEMPVRTGELQQRVKGWMARRPPRGRLAVAGATAATCVAAVVWIAALPAPSSPARPPLPPASLAAAQSRPAESAPSAPLAVGASVMLAAAPELHRRLGRDAVVDAAIARQPRDLLARLEAYRRAGALPGRVAVQLGENGPVWSSDIRRLREALRGVPRVVLVNVRVPRSWESQVNETLAEAVAGWPEAVLADWHEASRAAGLLYGDGTHPDPKGQRLYSRLVARAFEN